MLTHILLRIKQHKAEVDAEIGLGVDFYMLYGLSTHHGTRQQESCFSHEQDDGDTHQ